MREKDQWEAFQKGPECDRAEREGKDGPDRDPSDGPVQCEQSTSVESVLEFDSCLVFLFVSI